MAKEIIKWAKQKGLSIKLNNNAIFLTKHYQIDRDTKVTISIVVKQKHDHFLVSVWKFTNKRTHWDWFTKKDILWRESKVNKEEIVDYLEMVYDYVMNSHPSEK